MEALTQTPVELEAQAELAAHSVEHAQPSLETGGLLVVSREDRRERADAH